MVTFGQIAVALPRWLTMLYRFELRSGGLFSRSYLQLDYRNWLIVISQRFLFHFLQHSKCFSFTRLISFHLSSAIYNENRILFVFHDYLSNYRCPTDFAHFVRWSSKQNAHFYSGCYSCCSTTNFVDRHHLACLDNITTALIWFRATFQTQPIQFQLAKPDPHQSAAIRSQNPSNCLS